MEVEQWLHMANGDGENSYATNSRLQEKAMLETRPVLQGAVVELYRSLPDKSTMVVADLGCSSGPNTLLLVSEVIGTISDHNREEEQEQRPPAAAMELQFFLNDLPGNDFNLVFRSLDRLQELTADRRPQYYVAGMPGSFYTRLFPCRSVHLFHSSYSLMWRSKVPDELSRGAYLNEESIYIGKSTPPAVIKLYQEEYQKDLSLFLTLRFNELVRGGHMVLTFLGRKSKDMLLHGEASSMWDLLAQALLSLVLKGLVEKEKLVSFNLPFYAPSMDEVKAVVEENNLFNVEHMSVFESSWDPQDYDTNDDVVLGCSSSGLNVARCIRAVAEPLIKKHFGEAILDDLFMVYASMISKHLKKAKAKYPIIIIYLKAKH
uniref:Salicylate O-methyltransferase n=2 Tax=Triticum urartu TaxID=4572 RepID=A0A8R7K4Y8_TRIUA